MLIPHAIDFTLPTRILFGTDTVNNIGEIAVEYANKAFLITNGDTMRKIGLLPKIENLLEKSGVDYILYDNITRDPSNDILDEIISLLRQSRAKLIIALGGRSVINTAKACSYVALNDGSIVDYLNGKIGENKSIPVIAIPTIPGIENVICDYSILRDSNDGIKKEIKNNAIFPKVVIYDPKINISLPQNYIFTSGVAILSNAIESYISSLANAISDSLSLRAIELVAKNLRALLLNRDDITARSAVLMGSLLTELSLLTSKVGICNALGLALSSKTEIYQNIAMAVLLPHVMEFNLTVAPNKYVQIARAFGEDISKITVVEAAIKAVEGVRKLLFDLKIPQKLSDYNVNNEDLPHIASIARRYNFLNYLPTPVSKEDLLNIMFTAYE